jgi:hypothetical protein
MDFTITGNDVIKKYQVSKINSKNIENIEAIIIGDSSAGNSINAKLFSQLTGKKTLNLSLTGGWGFYGDLGILKKVNNKTNSLKNVYIVHSPDIWSEEQLSYPVFELFEMSDAYDIFGFKGLLGYFFNIKEILWNAKGFIKRLSGLGGMWRVNDFYDYIAQNEKTFSNGLIVFDQNISLNRLSISHSQIKSFLSLQAYCIKANLNCVFMHGVLHRELFLNSTNYLNRVDKTLERIALIRYIESYMYYENILMGDSTEHIDNKHKDLSTVNYVKAFEK